MLRPKLEVFLTPAVVHPGESFVAKARLSGDGGTKVRGVEMVLQGSEVASYASDTAPEAEYRRSIIRLIARHDAKLALNGSHEVASRFSIPAGAPPSYKGHLIIIEYELLVRAAVPWWLDRVGRYVVQVALRPTASVEAAPKVFVSRREGATGKAPYAECSLESNTVSAGGVIAGMVSFYNTSAASIGRVQVSLIQHEAQFSNGMRAESARYYIDIPIDRHVDGKAWPFRLRVPPNALPNFRSAFGDVRWRLEVSAAVGMSRAKLLEMPLEIVDAEVIGARGVSAPLVGDARKAQLWERLGALRGLRWDGAEAVLRKSLGEVQLAVTSSGGKEPTLDLELSWPLLGMELDVGPAAWKDQFSTFEIVVGDKGFDDAFRVRGRNKMQVKALLDGDVRAAMRSAKSAHVRDAGATLSFAGDQLDERALAQVLAAVDETLRVFDRATRAVPVPERYAAMRDHWERYAEQHDGRFEPGRVWVHKAEHQRDRVSFGIRWSSVGEALDTYIELALPGPLSGGPESAAAESWPSDAKKVAASLKEDGVHCECDGAVVRATIPRPVEHPSEVSAAIEGLSRIAKSLCGVVERGPFR